MGAPRGATKIYAACLSLTVVRYGKEVEYEIPENRKAAIYGLENGDVLICSKSKSPLVKGGGKFLGYYIEIRAKKGPESLWPNELFKHEAKLSSKGAVYVQDNGDILIHSIVGRSLWKNFHY